MKKKLQDYLDMLGLRVRDRVNGAEGIVTSVSFDLYGCVQCIVDLGMSDKDERKALWFDHKRLEILNDEPVMDRPSWDSGPGTERGGFSKPLKE